MLRGRQPGGWTAQIESDFEAWGKKATRTQRTPPESGSRPGVADWEARALEVIVSQGIDEPALVESIAVAVREEGRGTRREELMARLGRISTVDPAAQKLVAELIVELASSRSRWTSRPP